ncbi:MAG: FG-GAP-like repeat-containing protein [Candidatus Electryonea clarkiae]|nr:FG-GAP-like repeat-containing protein [Candidatus Electryonea clarkiae]MDP8289186.1 FG-GAP-like repeat-containing protein [Candidatus Electryonea clarkiae]
MKNLISYLLFGSCLICFNLAVYAQSEFVEHILTDDFDTAYSVFASDLDSDDDIDILGTANSDNDIVWWENDGDRDFTIRYITRNYDGAAYLYPVDLDDDDDMDILSTSRHDGYVTWWLNDGDEDFIQLNLIFNLDEAAVVLAIDLDNDDDQDILATGYREDVLIWLENNGRENFTRHTISNIDGAHDVDTADLDNDGDIDIIASASMDDAVYWWENDGNEEFEEHIIESDFNFVRGIFAIDLDGDEDIDVLGSSDQENENIVWWENDGNGNFDQNVIDGNFVDASDVFAIDLDRDQDIDVIGTSRDGDEIAWWENDGNENFTKYVLDDNFDGANSVFAIDLDDDGDNDILGAAAFDDEITWWENLGTSPDDFLLVSPENGELVYNDTVMVTWTSSSDPDGFEYNIEWSLSNEFIEESTTYESTNDTTFVISDVIDFIMTRTELDELPDDSTIYWRVKAVDIYGAYKWADDNEEGWSFDIYLPEPPSSFHLLSPEDRDEESQANVTFEWEVPENTDPGDVFTFTIHLAEDEDFTVPSIIEVGRENSAELEDFSEDQTYWWKVLAEDRDALSTCSEETWSFYYNQLHPPTNLHAELDEANGEVTLSWNHVPGAAGFLHFVLYRDSVMISTPIRRNFAEILPTRGVYRYWVTANYLGVETEAVDTATVNWDLGNIKANPYSGIPSEYAIISTYPNPFNPALTTIIGLPEPSVLNLQIINILGEEVTTITNGIFLAGVHKFSFDGSEYPAGIYFIQANVPGKMREMKKVVLVK